MFPRQKLTRKSFANGSALVVAIFVIIVISLLGVALIKMLSTEAESIAYEVMGTRAFQAAQSGMQRQLQQVFPLSSPARACLAPAQTFSFAATNAQGRGLTNCQAFVTCNQDVVNEVPYYQLTSEGQCQIAGVITSRKIAVEAKGL
ncbi:PilX N-terminal domain-containing pilus assembly protein [Thalassotalea ganghwensis]